MQSNLSTAHASAGGAGAIGVIAVWLLSTFHVQVPPEVAVAMTALLTPLIHIIAVWMTKKTGVDVTDHRDTADIARDQHP